jgi:DNA polymerase III subunit beta
MPMAIINRASLASAVAVAAMVAERRNTVAVLCNIALAKIDGRLVARATDLDIETTIALDGAADDDFATTIPVDVLFNHLSKSESEMVKVVAEEQSATFDFDGHKVNMLALPFADFPAMKAMEGEVVTFDISTDALHTALNRVAFAISSKGTRHYLNGIYMHGNEGNLRMVATDGHRLALHDTPTMEGWKAPHGVIIPREIVRLLQRLTKPKFTGVGKKKTRATPEIVTVTVSAAKIRFTVGNVTVYSKLIDGDFPDYRRVIPIWNPKTATVNKNDFACLIDHVSTFKGKEIKTVRLEFYTGHLTASLFDPNTGISSGAIACGYSGPSLGIGFNARHLMDIIRQCDSDFVTMRLAGAASPALIQSAYNTLFVLVPMRI